MLKSVSQKPPDICHIFLSRRGIQTHPRPDTGLQVSLRRPQGSEPGKLGRDEVAEGTSKKAGRSKSVGGVDTPTQTVRGSDTEHILQQVGGAAPTKMV